MEEETPQQDTNQNAPAAAEVQSEPAEEKATNEPADMATADDPKFAFYKTVKLDFMGGNHTEDFLQFDELTFVEAEELADATREADRIQDKEAGQSEEDPAEARRRNEEENKKANERLIKLLQNKFVTGSVYNDRSEKRVTVYNQDLKSLPMRVVVHAAKQLTSADDEDDENLGEPSTRQ